MPGTSYSGPLPAATPALLGLDARLREHVTVLARRIGARNVEQTRHLIVARVPTGVAVRTASSILESILMPTSVHIPKPLLVAVDRRARALKISRNRLIVQALQREVTAGTDWSPGFFERLASPEPAVQARADEMLRAIQGQRRSKKPVQF